MTIPVLVNSPSTQIMVSKSLSSSKKTGCLGEMTNNRFGAEKIYIQAWNIWLNFPRRDGTLLSLHWKEIRVIMAMNWKVPRCKTYGYIMIQKKMVKRKSCTFLFRLPQCSPRVYIDIFQDNKCGINDKIRLLPFCNNCWKEEWWLIVSKTKTQKWMPSGKLHNR